MKLTEKQVSCYGFLLKEFNFKKVKKYYDYSHVK